MMSFVQRRRFLWICFLIALLLLGLTAAFANATTFARLRLEDLARQSTAVARLRCLGSEFRWDRGELWTETRFEILERNKGLLSGLVTVRTIGGASGHLHSHVDGVPVFRPGEEVYLFLWERPGEPYRVLGWAQGTFASPAMPAREPKPSRKIPRCCPSSTRARAPSATAASVICL